MQIGPYRVAGELGRGGMGVVYEARDAGGERVAVKVLLDPTLAGEEELERFRREAEACQRLSHPGLVPLVDLGTHQGRPYVVLKYLEGPTLAAVSKTQGPSDVDDAVRLVARLAEALAHAHAHGVVHRDVKPDNVILVDGSPVLTDFGLARLGNEMDRLTTTGEVLGTPGFMAPEQANGLPDAIDGRTDVYALGALLYVLLTGSPPHPQRGPLVGILHAILTEEPRSLLALRPDAPPALADLCHRCLAKNPAERPTAQGLVAALEGALHVAPPARRTSAQALFVASLGLVAIVGLVALALRLPAAQAPTIGPTPAPSSSAVPASPTPRARPDRLAGVATAIEACQPGAASAALEAVPASERGARWLLLRGLLGELERELFNARRGKETAARHYRLALRQLAGGETLPAAQEAQLVVSAYRVGLGAEHLRKARRLAPRASVVAAATYDAQIMEAIARVDRLAKGRPTPASLFEAIRTARAKMERAFKVLQEAPPPRSHAQLWSEINHPFEAGSFALWIVQDVLSRLLSEPETAGREAAVNAMLNGADVDLAALERARRLCRAAIERAPRDPRLYYRLGRIRKLEVQTLAPGMEEMAVLARGRGLSAAAERLSTKARALGTEGALEEAVERLDRAIQLEPLYQRALIERGQLRVIRSETLPPGPRREALARLGLADHLRVIELDPREARNHDLLGVAYSQVGKVSAAIGAFAKTNELEPAFAPAWRRRAALCLEQGSETEISALEADLGQALGSPQLTARERRHLQHVKDVLERARR